MELGNPTTDMMVGQSATGVPSDPVRMNRSTTGCTIQGDVYGTGAVTATIKIEGSNTFDKQNKKDRWVTVGTLTLSGTNTASDGVYIPGPWKFFRTTVTAISGTGAACDATMGI